MHLWISERVIPKPFRFTPKHPNEGFTVDYLTQILCNTEHPLPVQVLHNGFTQVFLSLWSVPHCLCHHSTDLCIKILQRSKPEVSYDLYAKWTMSQKVTVPVFTLSMALPTFDTLPWMSLCREASICTVSLIFLQHWAIVWDRTDKSASCTPAKDFFKSLHCACRQ